MFYNSNFEYNDCTSKGACSVSPNISSMQEVMFVLLRQIAYYLLKLKDFDITKDEIIYDVISEIALIDAAKDLSEAQILDSFTKQYINLVKSRKEYLKICKEYDVECEDLNNLKVLKNNSNLSINLSNNAIIDATALLELNANTKIDLTGNVNLSQESKDKLKSKFGYNVIF